MAVHIPLTADTTLIGVIVMGYAWAYLESQIRDPHKSIQQSVRYMHKLFLYWFFFFGIMSIPYLWTDNPARFSLSAAWAYVVGHVFFYLGLMYVSRMTFVIVPRLNPYRKLLVPVWLAATAAITFVNAKTMIWGVRPTYNYKLHLTEFHTSPTVGIPLALMALAAFLPAAILFISSAWRARGLYRIKPTLLAIGCILVTTAGPLHDNARTAQMYAYADIFSIVGLIAMLLGIAFRIQVELTAVRPRRANVRAPSNTV